MPKTRNVSRSQGDAVNAKRKTRSAKENAGDNEKENKGRVTRTSTRAGSGRPALGASTTLQTAAKGKGKEKPPGKGGLTKTEKLPLQDITARYLPAPESANRGHPRFEADFDTAAQAGSIPSPLHLSVLRSVARRTGTRGLTARAGATYPSSLPPSSPPAQPLATAPQQGEETSDLPILPPSSPLPDVRRRLFPKAPEVQEELKPYNTWEEFDRVVQNSDGPSRPAPTPRNSDPFGFFALEKKLEVEREHQVEIEDEDEEAGDEILVADTSSPRPVRRLPKHKYVIEAEVAHRQIPSDDDFSQLPPTPQKTVDRTRYSHSVRRVDDQQLYSPGPSSCPSSPSPSKPRLSLSSSTKRKTRLFDDEAEHEEVESSPGKKQPRLEEDVEEAGERRQLRSRSVKVDEPEASTSVGEERVERKTRQPKAGKKGVKKGKSKTSSNVLPDNSDMDEWERERQVRLEYFRQLEDYDFETENVYVV